MKNEEKVFIFFLLFITTLMIILSLEYSPGSKMLPLLSGICTTAIMLFLVLMTFSSKIAGWYQRLERKSVLSTEIMKIEERRREISVIAWFSGCTAIIYFLGFMIGIPLFLFMFLKMWAKESWLLSVVLPAVVLGVVYFTFIYILRVPLHKGIFLE